MDRTLNTRFILSLAIVFLAALLQQTEAVRIFGVKPNFTLAVFAALVFFLRYSLHYVVAVLFGALLLKFEPGPQGILVALIGVGLAMFLVREWLPATETANVGIFAFVGTAALYLLADTSFLLRNSSTVAIEALLTTFTAILVHIALTRFAPHAQTFRLTR